MLRTHTCGQLTKKDVGEKVTLSGWVHRRRDHGGLIFVDLRDRYGLTQIKFDPELSKEAWEKADKSRTEWVLKVTGEVEARSKETVNEKISTGEIEVASAEVEILNESKTLPFEITDEKGSEAGENIRLKYRFLDLRQKRLQDLMRKRDEFITYIREYMHKHDFIDVATPILANSSPEGSRDFLVPSRIYPGKFFALPQAPQQFKQMLMVAGLDKYFQIAPCFRDEDPRADRHAGTFYQLDIEMSFVEQEDVWDMVEPLMLGLTRHLTDKELIGLDKNGKIPRIKWRECMTKYGSDKPDLRIPFEIVPISELVKDCGFRVFADVTKSEKGVVHALKVTKGGEFSRSQIDKLTDIAKEEGAKGLAYIVVKAGEIQSPIIKFLGEDLAKKIIEKVEAEPGDIIFFGADDWEVVSEALGAVRNKCGEILGHKDKKKSAWLWVTDFNLYKKADGESGVEKGKVDFDHNPFSMPQGGLKALEEKDPFDILAYQYDLVHNGFEMSSGAIRNHDPKIMYKAFEIAGYTKEEVDKKFGHMIKAFEFGAPPHGGIAPGIDRMMMTLFDLENIRDIYAFPKDGKGKDLMLNSPMVVEEKQLEELNIKLDLD